MLTSKPKRPLRFRSQNPELNLDTDLSLFSSYSKLERVTQIQNFRTIRLGINQGLNRIRIWLLRSKSMVTKVLRISFDACYRKSLLRIWKGAPSAGQLEQRQGFRPTTWRPKLHLISETSLMDKILY